MVVKAIILQRHLYAGSRLLCMNKPLNSRELKLILDSKRFEDLDTGIERLQRIIANEIETLGGSFKKKLEKEERYTWYLDTRTSKLKSQNFFLRIREIVEKSKYQVTLKCRHEDRYISSSYNLKCIVSDYKEKFEEDIIAPYVSKFSNSIKYEVDEEPKISNISDLQTLFPNLNEQNFLPNDELKKVKNFVAHEISCEIGKIVFDEGGQEEESVKTVINVWYGPEPETEPLIVEFTFDYGAKKVSSQDKILLEEFPLKLVKNIYAFYSAIQDRRIVDLDSSKTKTAFAYNLSQ